MFSEVGLDGARSRGISSSSVSAPGSDKKAGLGESGEPMRVSVSGTRYGEGKPCWSSSMGNAE